MSESELINFVKGIHEKFMMWSLGQCMTNLRQHILHKLIFNRIMLFSYGFIKHVKDNLSIINQTKIY